MCKLISYCHLQQFFVIVAVCAALSSAGLIKVLKLGGGGSGGGGAGGWNNGGGWSNGGNCHAF